MKKDDFYTTGRVAKLVGVAARTVAKWVDSKKLTGFRIPDSLDRRVPRQCLIDFIKKHKMSMPKELQESVSLIISISFKNCPKGWTHATFFEATMLIVECGVQHAIVGDEEGLDRALQICKEIMRRNSKAKVALILSESTSEPDYIGLKVRQPCNLEQVALQLRSIDE